MKVQGIITDCRCARATAHTRLVELGPAEVHHIWLWRLNPHHGPTLEPVEYVDSSAVGLRGPH